MQYSEHRNCHRLDRRSNIESRRRDRLCGTQCGLFLGNRPSTHFQSDSEREWNTVSRVHFLGSTTLHNLGSNPYSARIKHRCLDGKDHNTGFRSWSFHSPLHVRPLPLSSPTIAEWSGQMFRPEHSLSRRYPCTIAYITGAIFLRDGNG